MKISDLSENDCKPVFVIVISGLLIAFVAFFPMHQNVVACIQAMLMDAMTLNLVIILI